MLKLSVIVPVYNVSRYLAKCLDSLLCQDMSSEEYEIIVVNDGSTDDSGDIAASYAERYPCIKLINQDNQGLSGARNAGLGVASGKYVQFVDSDDYLEFNVIGGLVLKMETDRLDVLRFNYQNVNEEYQVYVPYKDNKPFVDYTDSITDGLTFLTERLGYACYAVQFMIRRELLMSDGCIFKSGVYFEDTEWTPRMLNLAERVTSVDTVVYNYLLRSGSITQSVSLDKKHKVVEDKLSLIASMKEQMAGKSDKRWYEGMTAFTVVSLLDSIVADFYGERSAFIGKLRGLDVFPLSDYHITPRMMRKVKLINISLSLYMIIAKVRRA